MNKLYCLPLLLGIIGGVIVYVLQRNKNKQLAERCLIFGIIWSIVGFIFFLLIIPSNGNMDKIDNFRLTEQQKMTVEFMENSCYDLKLKLSIHSKTLSEKQFRECMEKIDKKIERYHNQSIRDQSPLEYEVFDNGSLTNLTSLQKNDIHGIIAYCKDSSYNVYVESGSKDETIRYYEECLLKVDNRLEYYRNNPDKLI